MRRRHLFELEDQPWLPAVLRDLLTEQLAQELRARGTYLPIVPRLARAMARVGADRIVDLCSGAGGPALQVRAALEVRTGAPIGLVLTDRYPNLAAHRRARREAPGRVECVAASVDARAVPAALTGFRTMFTSFHHFRPDAAQRILQAAVDQRAPIAIFEFTHRDPRAPLAMARAAARVWYRAPLDLPRTPARLLFSCLLPLVPLMYYWDATVSHLRSYTPRELAAMTGRLHGAEYRWEVGLEARRITYLIGTPHAAERTD